MSNEEYTPEEAKQINKMLTLKEQASRLLAMKELMADFERGVEAADSKADATFGEEHQRHVGAKGAIKEWMIVIKRYADYQPPKSTKKGNSYA
jgi:maltooligosyltrehalose synthase